MDTPASEESIPRTPHVATARFRVRVGAGCMLLLGLAFIQAPGLLVADTKFDLVADPIGFLSRAGHLWDSEGALGQLQNQAYGYFWPMGPFFVLGDLLGMHGWVVQRLWMALVLCAAFTGAALLARAMGVRSDAAALIAAFAYATSPRILSTIGPASIEAWPSALAPWVLLPLVIGAQRGSPRRAAALAGLAVAMVGGVNAAATFAVIPLGVVWLLTRAPGKRRNSMIIWWPVFTLLGTLWWLVPLFVMGAYSPPFLDFIESASVTTFPTTLFDALRGTSAWVPYVDASWQGGNQTITLGYLALNSGLVLLLGLAGIASRRNPHGVFLVLSVLLGLFLVTLGHLGAVEGWFASALHGSLDGVLAPIRNVHKFDPIIRLPMVLGLAILLDVVSAESRQERLDTNASRFTWATRTPVLVLALMAVVGAAMPALGARLAPTNAVVETPDYWVQAADWLDEQSGNGAALLAPGSSFGDYLWGNPRDEPMQFLANSRWAIRNAVPLTNPGNIRMLVAIEARFNQGHGSPGLSRYLARNGIKHVVVRNDLRPSAELPDPAQVRQSLVESSGVRLVASFGPPVGGEPFVLADGERVLVDHGRQFERDAIEIYEVEGAVDVAATATTTPTVVGGPEDLLDLLDHDLIGDAPTVLAVDRATQDQDDIASGPLVLTDGMLDRERFFGRVHDASSSVRLPGDVRRSGNPVPDYQLTDDLRWRSTARLSGAKSVTASTSASDAGAFGGTRRGANPYAAVDGDVSSAWQAGWGVSARDWWRIEFDQPLAPGRLTITVGKGVSSGTMLRVETDGSSRDARVPVSGEVVVDLDEEASWLRISQTAASSEALALAEVDWEGRDLHRRIVTPRIPDAWGAPDAILLRSQGDRRTGCVRIGSRVPCAADEDVAAEEPISMDRVVTLPTPASYQTTLTARPRDGRALHALIQEDRLVTATGSTTAVSDARASGIAALDGDLATSWTADSDDVRPTLSVNFAVARNLRRVTLLVPDAAPLRRPSQVRLTWPGGTRDVTLDDSGQARFPKISTDRIQLTILETDDAVSIDRQGHGAALPAGITEMSFDSVGAGATRPATEVREHECGSGPTLRVDGRALRTRIVAAPADLFAMKSVDLRTCGPGASGVVHLRAGENIVDFAASDAVAPESVVLRARDFVAASITDRVAMETHGPTAATFRPISEAEVLVWHQNFNRGWAARQDGAVLDPVVLDGWQQGWRMQTRGAVRAEFTPDTPYRWGMGLGVLALAALLLGLLLGRRDRGADLPPVAASGVPPAALVAVGLASGGLLGGWVGLLVLGSGAAGAALLHKWRDAAAWLTGAVVAVASIGYFLRPWGSSSGWAGAWSWPSLLVLLSLGAAIALVARDAAGSTDRPRFLSRMKGFSTPK